MAAMRKDDSTPDTRPSDGAQRFTPVAVDTLVHLMLDAHDPKSGSWNLPGALRVENAWVRRVKPGPSGSAKESLRTASQQVQIEYAKSSYFRPIFAPPDLRWGLGIACSA